MYDAAAVMEVVSGKTAAHSTDTGGHFFAKTNMWNYPLWLIVTCKYLMNRLVKKSRWMSSQTLMVVSTNGGACGWRWTLHPLMCVPRHLLDTHHVSVCLWL